MRDPNRIDYYCDRLANLWNRVPDWRFGQFLINVLRHWSLTHNNDLFYVEDEEFFKFIHDYLEEILDDKSGR